MAVKSGGSSGSDAFGLSSLPGASPVAKQVLGEPQHGKWDYVVVDPKGLTLRSEPSYDPSKKTVRRIEEGEVVSVVEKVSGDGCTFLRIDSPQGWCFDQQPGVSSGKYRLRMMEVNVERGIWYYFVTAERGVAIRSRCSHAEGAKCGKGPLKGALVTVTERAKIGESFFLRLKEGGWIFDVKNGRKVLKGPTEMQMLPSFTMASVRAQATLGNNCSGGIHLQSSPTNQKWAVTKFFLLHASKVQATCCCEAEGICWIFVKKGEGGIEGWAPADTIHLESSPDSLRANIAMEAPLPPDVSGVGGMDRTPVQALSGGYSGAGYRSDRDSFLRSATGPALGSSPAPPPPEPLSAPPPPQAPTPLGGTRQPELASEKLLNPNLGAHMAPAMKAGFLEEPIKPPSPTNQNQTYGGGLQEAAMRLPSDPADAVLKCLGCGLLITPSNTYGKLGCCKGCGRRWSQDAAAPANAMPPPRASAVCWGPRGQG